MSHMELRVPESFNANIFTPYTQSDRDYALLFRRNGLSGPFYVSDSTFDTSGTLVQVGVIQDKRKREAGYMFYTKSQARVEGTFILAYSGNFKENVNAPRARIKEFGMELLLKADMFYLYNKKNEATLIVNPAMNSVIRRNFEV